MAKYQHIGEVAARWLGIQPPTSPGRLLHAFVGALFGLFLTALILRLWLGDGSGLPLLIAPVGASAVLLFAVPASPLAQPWAIVGGNTISALCGIAWMKLAGGSPVSAALAVATATALMALARCLHPPGGAVALTAVIGGRAVAGAGWSFALAPVALNSAVLVALGWLFNAVIRGNYPHRATSYTAADAAKSGYTSADIESVLAQYDELLDVSREDLDTLFREVETRAYRRLHGIIRCDQIMRGNVPTLAPGDPLPQARALFAGRALRSAPVVSSDGHLEGLLGADRLLGAEGATVAAIMDPSPCIAAQDTPIDALLPLLSGGIYQEALVVDTKGRLLGLISQTELLGALWRGHIAEQIALGAA